MPDYTVTVTKTKVVKQDVPVTAANTGAAAEAAIQIAKSYVLEKEVGTYVYTTVVTTV